MTDNNEPQKPKYERFKQFFVIARQRYLEAGGDPRKGADNRFLTEEEKKEFFALGRELGGVKIIDGYVHTAGRSWKLPENSPLLKNETAFEVKSDG